MNILVLLFYILVGVIGNPATFLAWRWWGGGPSTIERTKPAPAETKKAYWTQHKHIPSSTKEVSVSLAILDSPRYEQPELIWAIARPNAIYLHSSLEGPSHASRAPPHS
jgi:hypothetical protein